MKLPHLPHKELSPDVAANRHRIIHRIWRDPFFDWLIVFFGSVILSIVLAYVGFGTYKSMKADLKAASDTFSQSNKSPIDTGALSTVLEKYEARKNETVELYKTYSGPSDPSI